MRPIFSLLLVSFVTLVIGAGAMEIGLRLVAPTALVGVGWSSSAQGRLYGWGFDPGEMMAVRDPDSGELYLNRANRRGWRDRDHDFAKPPGVVRVVLLGDSNIFGFAVAADQIVGAKLEAELRRRGVNAEVISLAYSAWGTDQEVEALEREGMRYQPDVVILHFCGNDLVDNVMWRLPGKFGERRPFYYEAGPDGQAIRHDNPHYRLRADTLVTEWLFRHSELVKRIYGGWKTLLGLRHGNYDLSNGQVELIGLWLGPRATPALLGELRGWIGRNGLNAEILGEIVHRHGLDDLKDDLLHMALRINRQDDTARFAWHGGDPAPPDQWAVATALLAKAKAVAESGGARLLVSSELEEGRWRQEQIWHRVADTPETKQRYFALNDTLAGVLAKLGIPFIPADRVIQRARNDAHPNAEGDAALAATFADFLTKPASR